MRTLTDVWASGNAYEPYVGRWSRAVAREFIAWLAPARDARWLDVGCGTGALTEAIIDTTSPDCVDAVDASPAYVLYARRRVHHPRALFDVADACSLPLPAASVDVVVSGLMLNFIPEPSIALAEMLRVVRPGGTVAAYVWDYAGGMQLIRHFWDAAMELDPGARALDEGARFPGCRTDALEALFRAAGLTAVESCALEVPTHFRSFDEYWAPFLGGQGPAPGYAMSLAEPDRVVLRDRIRARLPAAADGSIELRARAWGVRGTKRELL